MLSLGPSAAVVPVAENLLNRKFQPTVPNAVWTSDITYIATDEGWLYLAVVIDLFSRQIVGWSMQPHMRRELVMDALRMAWFRRQPGKEARVIFHSDRGSPILQRRLPRFAYELRHAQFDEPQGQLLGHCADGEPVGLAEGRPAVRAPVRDGAGREG